MRPHRYSPEIGGTHFDAIVIGSGLGGLTTASILARFGKKVAIFEKHDVPGGFTHTFKRRGYEWDVGVHYVGQMGEPEALMRKLFDYVTDGKLEWAPMGDVYDRMIVEGETYDFVRGRENLIARLISRFPEEEKGIRGYFARVDKVNRSMGLFFGERSMPWLLSRTVGWLMRRSTLKQARRTTLEVIRELTSNPRLIAVLCSQCGDYGLAPGKSSFAIHAALVAHYLDGGNYPVGGAGRIAETLIEGIEQHGGKLVLDAGVKRILVKDGRAAGIELENGEKVFGSKIVSNAGAFNTFRRLWPREVPLPDEIDQGLKKIRPSIAHVCLYVGLNASDEALNLPKNNVWVYESSDFDGEYARLSEGCSFRPMVTYISFPSAKDPAWAAKRPGRATIQVIAPCRFDWVEKWQNQPWRKRDAEYNEMKMQWEKVLLEKLISVVPQIEPHVDFCEVSTPLSTKHFSDYQHGEIYGLEHTPERMSARWLRAHTPLKNLYLTGQDLLMVGVGGALFSGVVTSVAILRRNVMAPVFRRAAENKSPAGH